MAADQTLTIVIRIRDLASKSLLGLKRGLGGLKAGLGAVAGAAFSLQGALLALGGGLIARSFIGIASSFEQMEKQLDQLTRGKGTETLKELNDWAKTMPVNTQQAVAAFVQMQAFGLNPTLEKMEILTDIATVMGEQALPRVSRALGQMAALGKISGEELNQLSEIGVNGRKILTEAFGMTVEELQKSGIEMEKIIDAIWKGLEGQYGGASIRALDSWQGIMTVLASYWTEFMKLVSDSGVFEYMKAAMRVLLDMVQELEKSGSMKEFAQQISDYGIKAIKIFAQAIAVLIDGFNGLRMTWEGVKGAFALLVEVISGGIINIYHMLSNLLQKVGETIQKVAALMEKIDFTGLSSGVSEAANNFGEMLKSMEGAPALLKDINAYAMDIVDATAAEVVALGSQETALKKIQKIIADIDKAFAERDKKKGREFPEEKPPKVIKPELSGVSKAASELAKINADTQAAMQRIRADFEEGTISAEEYYNAQVVGAKQAYIAEQALLQEQLASTDKKKIDKVQKIQDQIYASAQKHNMALFALDQELTENKRKELDKERQIQKHYRDLQARELAATSSESEITSTFTQELLAMDNKHAEEIQRLKDHKADMAVIEDTYRIQELEKDKLQADQRIRLNKMILDATSQVLGDTASAFEDLYNATGKKHKEYFYIYKSAAIAQAIIDTYKGATSAYSAMAGIPYVGPALGVAAATAAIAAGIARVATIRSQSLAEGGPVLGRSPHPKADNVPINATAGEFMQPVSAVRYYGANVMEAIRSRVIPKELLTGFRMPSYKTGLTHFATGGMVAGQTKAKDESKDSGVTINNIVDPQMMDQHLVSKPGQRSVMNVISENKYELKQLVLGD